jgi:hypothetical protein
MRLPHGRRQRGKSKHHRADEIAALQTKIFSHCGEMECMVIAFFEGKEEFLANLIHEVLTKKTLCTTV